MVHTNPIHNDDDDPSLVPFGVNKSMGVDIYITSLEKANH